MTHKLIYRTLGSKRIVLGRGHKSGQGSFRFFENSGHDPTLIVKVSRTSEGFLPVWPDHARQHMPDMKNRNQKVTEQRTGSHSIRAENIHCFHRYVQMPDQDNLKGERFKFMLSGGKVASWREETLRAWRDWLFLR